MVNFRDVVGLSQVLGGVFLMGFTFYVYAFNINTIDASLRTTGLLVVFIANLVGLMFVFQGIVNIKEVLEPYW